jgi:hypothetical protein
MTDAANAKITMRFMVSLPGLRSRYIRGVAA